MRKKGSQFIEGGLGLEDLHPSLGGNRVPEHLSGEVSKHVMARAGITQQGDKRPGGTPEGSTLVGRSIEHRMPAKDEPLVTAQKGLSSRVLQVYGGMGAPSKMVGSELPYVPMLVTERMQDDASGEVSDRTWLGDGHHRIITNRLGNNRVNEAE